MNKELILVMNEKLPINIKEEINDNLRLQILEETKKAMWSMVEYKELQMMYSCALKAIQTKFEILNTEFKIKHKRNPISNITTRLKRNESVIKKLIKYNKPISIESIENNLHDFAGIRIVCTYIDDIYMLADALIKQDDVILIEAKDYIKNPKPNGYRSLHLIVEVPIFLSDKKKNVKVIIYTNKSTSKLIDSDIHAFNKQYSSLSVRYIKKVHDRYIIIDREKLYHIGHSIKDLGKKIFLSGKSTIPC